MMPFFARDEQIDLSSPLIAPHAPDGVLRRRADRYYIDAEANLNSLQGLFKVESLNRRELTFKALAGLIGGAIGWLPVELSSHNLELTQQVSSRNDWAVSITMWLLYGCIGSFVLAAGQQVEWNRTTQQKFIRGFGICALIGIIGYHFSNQIFREILIAGGFAADHPGSLLYLVIARVVGWTLFGIILGVGVGIASFEVPNIVKGAVGGLAGGFLGGIAFDLIGSLSTSGLLSRLVGFCAIGMAIGLFIGLVQELTKAAWVTVDQGRLRGRQYRVEGPRASIGRAEENPVGLFGDPGVQPRHALIERRGADYMIKNLAVQDGTFVNGNRIETVDLHDGDRINIGGYELRFHLRGTGTSQAAREQASLAADPVNPAHVARRLAGANANVEGPCLIDASGQQFSLPNAAAVRVGRALDNEIVVSHSSVSRHHASLENINGTVMVKDLNSQNSTFVGNRRVTGSVPLNDGDTVRFGDAQFTFRAGN